MDLSELSAKNAVNAIRDGDISAEAYAKVVVGQAQRHSELNAFLEFAPERVLEAGRDVDIKRKRGDLLAPLSGIPIGIKDNIETEGIVTTGGTPLLQSFVPRENAPVVSLLLSAGASVLGKTNLHELAYGITTNNSFFGPSRNPLDLMRIPGGSSGGSAVAVAARITPVALGTDTGGSVRIPASLCGVVGFRPSTGRWSQTGVVPISGTRDTVGPITRTVEDAALIDALVTSDDVLVPRPLHTMKLGVPKNPFWLDLDSETERVCLQVLTSLEDLGVQLVDADAASIFELSDKAAFPIALHETAVQLPVFLRERGVIASIQEIAEQCGSADVRGILLELAGSLDELAQQYQHAMQESLPALVHCYEQYFGEMHLDGMIFPTTPAPAPMIGEDQTFLLNGKPVPTFTTFVRNTGPGTIAGIPGISLPVGLTKDGLPVGIEIDAPHGSDQSLLALAMAVENAIGSVPA